MKLTLSVVDGSFNDKEKCKPQNQFLSALAELSLNHKDTLCGFFTSTIHSPWMYEGKRSVANTTAMLCVAFDFDLGNKTFKERVKQFKDYAGVVYISTSHTKKKPKVRVLLVLDEPVTDSTTLQPLCDWLKREYPDADKEVFKVSQPLFPCCEFNNGEKTTGFPLFELAILKGKPFVFPPEAFEAPVKEEKPKDTGGWEAAPGQFVNRDRNELRHLLEYYETKPIREGARNKELFRVCAKFRQCEYSKEEAFDALCKLNAKHVKPPYVERGFESLETIVTHVYDDKSNPPAPENWAALRKAIEVSKSSYNTNIDYEKLLSGDAEVDDDDEEYVKRPYSVAELIAGGYKPEPLDLVGEWFSWRKRITLLVGREKTSGKSTICTFEALAALRKGHRILWVSPDEPQDDILYRLIKGGVEEYADQVDIVSDRNVPSGWPELGEFIKSSKPDLIILDSVHSLFPYLTENEKTPENSDGAGWQKLISRLRPLAITLNIAIVWIHHANKATGLATGSIGITAGVDAIVTLTPSGTMKPNRRTLAYLGRRVGAGLNCAVDYLDEERGFERVKNWGKEQDEKEEKVLKSDLVLGWAKEFVAGCKENHFRRSDMATAYVDHFHENCDKGKALGNVLTTLTELGIILMREGQSRKESLIYDIINLDACVSTKPSDLIGETDDGEND